MPNPPKDLNKPEEEKKVVSPPPAPPVEAGKLQDVPVKTEETKDLLSVKDVTREVLSGRWGVTASAAMEKLGEAGYDVDVVWAEFQRRKAGGAPSAF